MKRWTPQQIRAKALRAAAAVAVTGCGQVLPTSTSTEADTVAAAEDGEELAEDAGDPTPDTTARSKPDTSGQAVDAAADAPADGAADVAANAATDVPAPSDVAAGADAAGDADASDATDVTADADDRPQCKGLTDQARYDCCNALNQWCNAAYPPPSQDATTCQFGPGYDGSTGCIPWGPPAPPAFEVA